MVISIFQLDHSLTLSAQIKMTSFSHVFESAPIHIYILNISTDICLDEDIYKNYLY